MNITGKQLVDAVAKRLEDKNILQYDSYIVAQINRLTPQELSQIVSFGDVTQWRNERTIKEEA